VSELVQRELAPYAKDGGVGRSCIRSNRGASAVWNFRLCG
jgi:hypothetical protein